MADFKIALPDSFIPNFINEELIVVDESFQAIQNTKLESLGKEPEIESNSVIPSMTKKHLVIIQFQESGKSISQVKSFVHKVLAAVQIKPTEIDIVDISRMDGMNARTIIGKSPAKHIVTFGVGSEPVKEMKVFNFGDKKVLVSTPIEPLQDNKNQKMKLWNLLKVLYQID